MTMPHAVPQAVFSGALGDNASGGWYPAQAVVQGGVITLWVASPAGWTQAFSAPAQEVRVKSAAQRITLVVQGRSYPILADPGAVGRALRLNGMGAVGSLTGSPALTVAGDVGRGMNQAAAAQAFAAGGGGEFLAAARQAGSRVSRLGYGAIAAIGCGGGVLLVAAVLLVTVFVLNL